MPKSEDKEISSPIQINGDDGSILYIPNEKLHFQIIKNENRNSLLNNKGR